MTVQNAFLSTLNELRAGEALIDLNAALIELVAQVRSVQKPGELTLKIKVALAKGSTSTLVVTDEVKLSEPKPDREVTIMFADDNNLLSRRDPRQPKLDGLQVPPAQFADVKPFPQRPIAVNEKTGEIRE